MTKKEQIVAAAIELFATEGYENTSVQKLAEKAAVAQGLLYRHFKNKENLLQHIAGTGIEQVQNTLAPYSNNNLSFSEAFHQHIKLTCSYLKSSYNLWKVIHNARLNNTIGNAEGNDKMIKEIVLKPIVSKLKTTGHKEAEMHAWYIFSLVDGMTSLYLAHPTIYPLSKIEKFLVNKAVSI